MKKINNYILPNSNYDSLMMIMALIVTIVTFFLMYNYHELYVLTILLIFPVLYFGLSMNKSLYEKYNTEYKNNLENISTQDILVAIEENNLDNKTIEMLMNYLNKNRKGWSKI